MHCLQVLDLKALQVPLCRLDAVVTEDFREVEEIPASPEIANRKRMPEGVRAYSHAVDLQSSPEAFKVSLEVAHCQSRIVACSEEVVCRRLAVARISPQSPAKLE